MTADDTPDLVLVGRVVKPHGIRGEVVVEVLSDVPDRLAAGVAVEVGGRPMTVTSSRPHQRRLLVTLDGVADRTAAEGLRGAAIEAVPVDLGDSDVYWVHELVGLQVVTEDGRAVGMVVDLIELPSVAGYDLLEVEHDGARWLLPASDDLVEIGVADDGSDVLVVVDPPAGLLPGTEDEAVVAERD